MAEDNHNPRNSVPADAAFSDEAIQDAEKEMKQAKAAEEAGKKPRITVNGIGITQDDINREVQYHPAKGLFEAKKDAGRALVVRELLLQEALKQGLCKEKPGVKKEDEVINALLEQEINTPEPDEETCRRYFENNRQKFKTSPLYDVSHILLTAPPNKAAIRKAAREQAEALIADIKEGADFAALARQYSSCSSKDSGGHMGQISKGETTPAFEKALFKMKKGEVSQEPVETRFGFHIIKVHQTEPGQDLDYDSVREWIGDYLKERSWQQAASQYIQILAGQADIKGINMKQADSPLVQ